jgi:hypothetical protein
VNGEIAIRKCVVNSFPIRKADNTQDAAAQFRDDAPEAHSPVWLNRALERIRNDSFAPFSSKVRALAQDLFLEIPRSLHLARRRWDRIPGFFCRGIGTPAVCHAERGKHAAADTRWNGVILRLRSGMKPLLGSG